MQCNDFTFHSDGTVEWHGWFGKRLDRAHVREVTLVDTRMNKPAVGRAVGAMVTGGLNLFFTSGRTGEMVVTIITDRWTRVTRGRTSPTCTRWRCRRSSTQPLARHRRVWQQSLDCWGCGRRYVAPAVVRTGRGEVSLVSAPPVCLPFGQVGYTVRFHM